MSSVAAGPAHPRTSRSLTMPWAHWLGAAMIAGSLIALSPDDLGWFVATAATISLVAWAVWAALPMGTARDVVTVVAALAGSASLVQSGALVLTAVIIAVAAFSARPARRWWAIVLLIAVCASIITVVTTIDSWHLGSVVAAVAGLVLGALIGTARRQAEYAAYQERQLAERSMEAAREHDRAQLLAERNRIARDVHDVLAHSLGGLSVQLGAAEALLAAGRTAEGTARVADARELAAEGLAEARRAVAALRDPSAVPARAVDRDALYDLVGTHRALGAGAVVEGALDLTDVDDRRREVLMRILQEALSNARRHAPGQTTRITAARGEGLMRLRLTTPLPAPTQAPVEGVGAGAGQGLAGMRERVAELGDASTVTAGATDADFVVAVEVVLP